LEHYVTVSDQNLDMLLDAHTILIGSLRNSRIRCKQLAIVEMYAVLEPFGGIFITNCPLAGIKGKIAFFVPVKELTALPHLLRTIGYCDAFYTLSFDDIDENRVVSFDNQTVFAWKKHNFWVSEFFTQDPAVYQAQSSHNRPFRIISNGAVKDITGYRGDGSALGRRALPAEDCRCMLHLSFPLERFQLLDPFAGSGGIIYAASAAGLSLELYSADIDDTLSPGLEMYGARHFCGDSAQLDFGGTLFDAVISETPFAPDAIDTILSVLSNVARHLKSSGRITLMCARYQSQRIRTHLKTLGFHEYLFYSIDRKGTEVDIIAYSGTGDPVREKMAFLNRIKVIY